jgi:hypothetical protein
MVSVRCRRGLYTAKSAESRTASTLPASHPIFAGQFHYRNETAVEAPRVLQSLASTG